MMTAAIDTTLLGNQKLHSHEWIMAVLSRRRSKSTQQQREESSNAPLIFTKQTKKQRPSSDPPVPRCGEGLMKMGMLARFPGRIRLSRSRSSTFHSSSQSSQGGRNRSKGNRRGAASKSNKKNGKVLPITFVPADEFEDTPFREVPVLSVPNEIEVLCASTDGQNAEVDVLSEVSLDELLRIQKEIQQKEEEDCDDDDWEDAFDQQLLLRLQSSSSSSTSMVSQDHERVTVTAGQSSILFLRTNDSNEWRMTPAEPEDDDDEDCIVPWPSDEDNSPVKRTLLELCPSDSSGEVVCVQEKTHCREESTEIQIIQIASTSQDHSSEGSFVGFSV